MNTDLVIWRKFGSKTESWEEFISERNRRKREVMRGRENEPGVSSFISLSAALRCPSKWHYCGYTSIRMYSRVVVLDHQAHGPGGRQVLVQTVWTHVVERVWRARIPIGAGEVYPHLLTKQPYTTD